jgi:hypothetical protein
MAFERSHDPEELERLIGGGYGASAPDDGYSQAGMSMGMPMGGM